MTTNIQRAVEAQRKKYEEIGMPLLQYMAMIHKLSYRRFAEIFGISKGHAEAILRHKSFPSLELAVRISRYFDSTVDDLFAWRVDDTGERRPLVIIIPETGEMITLNAKNSGEGITLSGLAVARRISEGKRKNFGRRLSDGVHRD